VKSHIERAKESASDKEQTKRPCERQRKGLKRRNEREKTKRREREIQPERTTQREGQCNRDHVKI